MKGLTYLVTDCKFPPAVTNFIDAHFLSLADFLLSNSQTIKKLLALKEQPEAAASWLLLYPQHKLQPKRP